MKNNYYFRLQKVSSLHFSVLDKIEKLTNRDQSISLELWVLIFHIFCFTENREKIGKKTCMLLAGINHKKVQCTYHCLVIYKFVRMIFCLFTIHILYDIYKFDVCNVCNYTWLYTKIKCFIIPKVSWKGFLSCSQVTIIKIDWFSSNI